MRAMVLSAGSRELQMLDREAPIALPGDVLVKVRACGVCRTDLHIIDGGLPVTDFPLVPGHEIVGVVEDISDGVVDLLPGDRVGIPWVGYTCEVCEYCRSGRDNLCPEARFTGFQTDGGYAEYVVADARHVFKIPDAYSDADAAPLLCAGLVGYRAYRMTGEAKRIGIYGFGTAAHIITQVAVRQGRRVYAFTAPGDAQAQRLALSVGAAWSGPSTEPPPEPIDAAIVFAPVGALVLEALSRVAPGGTVVCAGMHMSDVPSLSHGVLSGERVIRSVSNPTRKDAADFLALAPTIPVKMHVQQYWLGDANHALSDLREGRVDGAPVLMIESS